MSGAVPSNTAPIPGQPLVGSIQETGAEAPTLKTTSPALNTQEPKLNYAQVLHYKRTTGMESNLC